MATNGSINASPKITLYTNHGCPFAQRAHITLDELNIKYEEVIIDLETPRPQWYLDLNPRGLVPAMKYSLEGVQDEVILTESAVVAQFLCDSFPSHLMPASSGSASAALTRAKINFFCQTWNEKVTPSQMSILRAQSAEERDEKVKASVAVLEKEIEPLLTDAAPFFGGSEQLTFAEVFAGPFVQRFHALAEHGELLPKSMLDDTEKLPHFAKWYKAILAHRNATRIFEKEAFVEASKRRIMKMREAHK